jgi:beta-glucosidase
MGTQDIEFKKDFRLGVSTASSQIEGGDVSSNWNKWYEKGKIKDSSNPANANKHYELYKEDCKLLNDLGIKYYRLSFEWARISPKENYYDISVMNHYLDELKILSSYGIKCMLTLHHFSSPSWFEEKGGFYNPNNNKYFLDYCKFVVENVSPYINEYLTINEPNVYAFLGYLEGSFPPGETSVKACLRVMENFASIHIDAYKLIHAVRESIGYQDTKVSFAAHMISFEPFKNTLINGLSSKIYSKLFQDDLNKAFYLGKFSFLIKNRAKHKKGIYADFIALNYYTRNAIKGFKRISFINSFKNDLDWEIYPKGMINSLNKLYKLIKKDIYITENGTCDNLDAFRSKYIYDHLKEISNSALPIKGYYHWCFTDNFEWAEGESSRFGIVHIDYLTQKRTIKKSGYFFKDIISNNGINDTIYKKYIESENYHK